MGAPIVHLSFPFGVLWGERSTASATTIVSPHVFHRGRESVDLGISPRRPENVSHAPSANHVAEASGL
ncbi:hypothetical protein AB1N83_012078 [Pleurotus pulmonarius]